MLTNVIDSIETSNGIFTANYATGQTAKEVYEEWLNQRSVTLPELEDGPTEIELLQEENKKLWDTVHYLMEINGIELR